MPPRPPFAPLFCALSLALAPGGARAAMSIYMTPEDLALRAGRIVEGTVADARSGLDPRTGALATYVTLDVTAVHRGPPERSRLILREPGGRFGDLVHEVDAVPVYAVGEHVFVFLEPADDGALRTTGMFFGKYTLDPDTGVAVRDLDGQGRILRGPPASREKIAVADLVAVAAAAAPASPGTPAGRQAPPEIERLEFERGDGRGGPGKFVALAPGYPTRWDQVDLGTPVSFDVERARNPLGSGTAAVAEILRAMASWTGVPESRIALAAGDTNASFTAAHPTSPTATPPAGPNVILFGDPYDDISNSGTCSGVIAVGGYWRSSWSSRTLNGITFYPALYGYVIFNDGLECFLGNPDNLAEVATHELGHAIGFGHSTAPDSIMRATAYGFRGPRLGDDDRDGAHCHYPHTLTVDGPGEGASWEAGTSSTIAWSASDEAGPDPGTLDLQYQVDGGPWQTIASGTANDGFYAWSVPDVQTDDARVRVIRPNRTGALPAGYPDACSAASTESFAILALPPVPGEIAAEGPSAGLRLDKAAGDQLRLSWTPSCSADADNYAVYDADLAALRVGRFNPQPLTCDAGPDLVEYVAAPSGSRFYLVAPQAGGFEGDLGQSTAGPRAAPQTRCATAAGVDHCD